MRKSSILFTILFLVAGTFAWGEGQQELAQQQESTTTSEAPAAAPQSEQGLRATEITNESQTVGGPGAESRVGDYLLANSEIEVVIGAVDHYNGYAQSGAHILDATLAGAANDMLDDVHTYYSWPKQIIYQDIKVTNDGSTGEKAVIEAKGHHNEYENLKMTTRYIIEPGERYITMDTVMVHEGNETIEELLLGDAAYYGYAGKSFVNGLGFTVNEAHTILVGGVGDGISYGLTTNEVDPETGDVRKLYNEYIYMDPIVKTVTLEPGDTAGYARQFIVGDGDIDSLLRSTYDIRNMQSGKVAGLAVSTSGRTIADATVDFKQDGKVYSTATTNSVGRYEAELAPGSYQVSIRKDGFKDKKIGSIKIAEKNTKRMSPVAMEPVDSNRYVWGPYLGEVHTDSITVSWKTLLPAAGTVKYAKKSAYEENESFTESIEAGDNTKFHEVKLSGLETDTEYVYQVTTENTMVGTSETEVNSFTTALPEGESGFSFVVYGDTRTYQERHKRLMNEMAKEDARFIMHTGDLVDDARVLNQLDGFFEAIRKPAKQIPFLPVIGNHEYGSKYFYDYFDVYDGGGVSNEQWYSFTYGNVKFIGLSSQVITMWNDEEAMEKQTEWLKKELENSEADFNFVVYHQPSYSSIKAPGNEVLRKYWDEIFQDYGVDAVFNADAHSYERLDVDGLPFIVAAGGGAPLYEVEERQPQTEVLNNTHLHYTLVTVKDGEATIETKKFFRVPNKDEPTQIESDKGTLDKFTISAE